MVIRQWWWVISDMKIKIKSYVCVHETHLCVHGWRVTLSCTCAWRGLRTSRILLFHSLLYSLDTRENWSFLVIFWSVHQFSKSWKSSAICHSLHYDYKYSSSFPALYTSAINSNSGPHACLANTVANWAICPAPKTKS